MTLKKKKCTRCGLMKPLAEFYREKRLPDGLTIYCKPCHRKISQGSRDPEKHRTYNREYMRRMRSSQREAARIAASLSKATDPVGL